ncbi:MAG: TlpA family protein disulfide reductase [Opitutae bacterium]|nr:TlpA family protein disulfide reductase [Opitutae bacterium]
MSRHNLKAFAVVLVLAVVGNASAEVKVGDAFPALASAGLTGSVPETKGKVLMVDFWASWCAPCRASFPVLARLHADFAARGLTIVAVGVDEKPSAYAAFVQKFAPPFVTVHDAAQKFVGALAVPGMPSTYLVGRDGRLRRIHRGFHGETTEKEWRTEIAALLAEQP